ncbi:phage tail protein [Nocardia sp. NPDC004711]
MNPLMLPDGTKIVAWDNNGRVWHLHGAGAGREGARITRHTGWMFAPVSLLVSEAARQDGATFERSVRSKKEWDFVVFLSAATVREFYAVHDAWFRGWSTDTPVTVGYFTRHQGWRLQRYQLDGAPTPVGDHDPVRNAGAEFQMSATAMDPLPHHLGEWDVWTNSLALGEGTVRARNAADRPGWARYTMPGPGRYGIEDPTETALRIVETPIIGAGEELRIDTHPRHRTARIYSAGSPSGRNVWGQLAGRRWFASLPPWSATDLVVRCTDGATTSAAVRVDVTPRSSRPY